MNRLLDKRALVTAAGQGIGRASALAMAREGAEVWATDVNEAALASLDAEWRTESRAAQATGTDSTATFAPRSGLGRIVTRRLDVLDPEAVRAAARELPAPQALFNCAGFVHHGTILDCDEEAWDLSLRLNMTAMYRMCRAFLPGMIANGGGSIVNMASVASSVIAAPNRFVYGATKAGVIGLTKAIAADFVGQGIRCNAICPGAIKTNIEQRTEHRNTEQLGIEVELPAGSPAVDEGQGDVFEVADTCLFLASDLGRHVSGVEIFVDGGASLLR